MTIGIRLQSTEIRLDGRIILLHLLIDFAHLCINITFFENTMTQGFLQIKDGRITFSQSTFMPHFVAIPVDAVVPATHQGAHGCNQ